MSTTATSFVSIAPRFSVSDRHAALTFYETLGFRATLDEGDFLIVSRDDVHIHLNVYEPPVRCSVCWISVRGIRPLYEACKRADFVKFPLEDKPYGLREFAVSDPTGNLILITEPIGG